MSTLDGSERILNFCLVRQAQRRSFVPGQLLDFGDGPHGLT
jgi:hypothetical protein